ncbi:MAG: hypothetical protein JWM23_531 [Microbacteriaceae bacterium]|nr:hypothetical protein [Microbacteriaceae bacterium]
MSIKMDFVFLAEWARAERDATITAASAGISAVAVASNEPVEVFVAGRFSRDRADGSHEFVMDLKGPDGSLAVSSSVTLPAAMDGEPWPEERTEGHLAFSLRVPMPIVVSGRYEVQLKVDDEQSGTLPLRVHITDAVAGV